MAAYCVSPFGAAERAWKPFNPILGETYELEVGRGPVWGREDNAGTALGGLRRVGMGPSHYRPSQWVAAAGGTDR